MISILPSWRVLLTLAGLSSTAFFLSLSTAHGAESDAPSARHKYSDEVARFAVGPAPAPGGILMVGSSIFRKWESCVHDFAPLPVTNRAFGGSHTEDQLFFFDQIIPSSRASIVVWYCGSNDLNEKATPQSIVKNTKEWIERTRAALSKVRIILVSVIRAPQKREAGLLGGVDEVNEGLSLLAGSVPDLTYVNVNPAMETPTGEPVPECYVRDKLHLTVEGYRRMTLVLRPFIEKEWATSHE